MIIVSYLHVLTDEEIQQISHDTGMSIDDVMDVYFELIDQMYFPSVQDVMEACALAPLTD
jgi:hypothetical protein